MVTVRMLDLRAYGNGTPTVHKKQDFMLNFVYHGEQVFRLNDVQLKLQERVFC